MIFATAGIQKRWRKYWRNSVAQNTVVAYPIAAENLERLLWISAVVVPLNLVHIAVFWGSYATSTLPHAVQWAHMLGWAHAGMALTTGFLAFLAYVVRKNPHPPWRATALSGVFSLSTLFFAGWIACIDQWVTPNITPFLICTLLTGVLIPLRPKWAITIYAVGFFLFYVGLGITQTEPTQLLSSRVNAMTATVMGLALSLSHWKKQAENLVLRRRLERRQTLLQAKYRQLEILASHDALTGLYTRKAFMVQAEQELARSQRYKRSMCVLVADLDFFKRVNDKYGHPVGDALLRHVSTLLQQAVRSTDVVARLGGEEFIILLPQTTLEEAMHIAEKIRLHIADTPTVVAVPSKTPHLEDHASAKPSALIVNITISIGVAALPPETSTNLETLYARADSALYQAKQTGRNRVCAQNEPPLQPSDLSSRRHQATA